MKGKFILLFFILSAVSLYGAEKRLTWDPVAGAYGYSIEIKDSQGNIVADTTVQENYYPVSQLEPGSYSFRIATLNVLKQKGESTPWIDFVIEKLFVPELTSVSKRDLLGSFMNRNIVVRGKNFKPGGKLMLRGNGKEIELKEMRINSESEIIFSYKPDKSLAGRYDLVFINRGDAETVLKDAVGIFAPVEAPLLLYLGAGCSASIPLGEWSEYYPLSYTGIDLFLQISARNFGYENIVFEAGLDAVRFNSGSSLRKSTYSFTTFGAGAGYFYPVVAGSIDMFAKFQAGAAYTMLSLDESPGGGDSSSTDLYALACAGLRVFLGRSFFVESGCGWKKVFYKGTPLDDVKISLGCGVML